MEQEQLKNLIQRYAASKQRHLNLRDSGLSEIPPEIGQLTYLEELLLDGNRLTGLPKEIGKLVNLKSLTLSSNQINNLPSEIGNLINLQSLRLQDNRLTSLPVEIGRLTKLNELWLSANALVELPKEIGAIRNLIDLWIPQNKITRLPSELGNLRELKGLYIHSNPLVFPPPEIVRQGTKAILAFLKEESRGHRNQWKSKLLLVGQGGVGKTALLRSLMNESFDPESSTTHGINIKLLKLAHPQKANTMMELNAWDFGGQEIYHATHQFFLTNRSLFLLVWNARHGYEQGRIYYWLDTIKARAPESPVIIVATHVDERDADLPLSEISKAYPQVAGHVIVSNKNGKGVQELKNILAQTAAKLPLMGEVWPGSWLDAAEDIRKRKEKYFTPKELQDLMSGHKVIGENQRILGQWLHELGDILYFQDDEEINDIIILKPQWVTEYISMILESEEVINQLGILTRFQRDMLWQDLVPSMRDHFLRLMERFDLSYRTLENREISLIVERLPLDPPEFSLQWDARTKNPYSREITMKFQLNTLQSGIPTWFIARSHRFTTHTHWRNGALFTDDRENKTHLALVQALPHERSVYLSVRGPNPQNFFALLLDGLELTLARFPGMNIDRLIPCPGHKGHKCDHYFRYEQLLKRIEHKKFTIECPEALEEVDARRMLFGLDTTTLDDVYDEIKKTQEESTKQHQELLKLLQREFIKTYRREQSVIDSFAPNIFVLRPREAKSWQRLLAAQEVELQLYCQEPGCWHPLTKDGDFVGQYTIKSPQKWFKELTPYLRKLIIFLKFVTPLIGPWVDMVSKTYSEQVLSDINFMKDLVKVIPELKEDFVGKLSDSIGEQSTPEYLSGASLRIFRELLDEIDPLHQWGGLRRVLTPEGHYLWLCEHHSANYIT